MSDGAILLLYFLGVKVLINFNNFYMYALSYKTLINNENLMQQLSFFRKNTYLLFLIYLYCKH